MAILNKKNPKLKTFWEKASAKDLHKFLWDMEQYFNNVHIRKKQQVSITSMCLVEDAKL